MGDDLAGERVLDEEKTNVFISYSRRDATNADRLHVALGEAGLNPYLDKHDIAVGEDWRARLGALIESADIVAFLISPDSVASEICAWEAEHAEQLGKRILPVVVRPVENETVPERLRRFNYVFMRDSAEEDASLPALVAALETDIAWVRSHTRYGELAMDWDRADRPSRLLLRGASISEAERWRDAHPSAAPAPTETQSAFIATSRAAATGRQRLTAALSLAVAAIAIGLSIFALIQRQAAETSRQETQATLAASDFRQGSNLLLDPETVPEGMAFLARAGRGGDRAALIRLWTLLQQRDLWVPAAEEAGAQKSDTGAAEIIPDDIKTRFATVHILGQTIVPTNLSLSGDRHRLVLTALLPDGVGDGPRVYVRVYTSEGAPITDWLSPFIQYTGQADPYVDLSGNEISAARGYLSDQGRYLVIEADNQNGGPQYLVPFDLAAEGGPKQIGGRIDASAGTGDESAVFSTLRFAAGNREVPEQIATLLVGTSAGAALAEQLSSVRVLEKARHLHRSAVTNASLDATGNYFTSAASDLTFTLTRIFPATSSTSALRADEPIIGAELTRSDGTLALTLASGKVLRFDAHEARPIVFANRGGPNDGIVGGGHEESCYHAGDMSPLTHPSGLNLRLASARVIEVVRVTTLTRSPEFAADIETACVNSDGKLVSVSTRDFRTSIWEVDFSLRRGPSFDEAPLSEELTRASATDWVAISPDGKSALVQSSIGGDDARKALTVWDIERGLPLTDRFVTVRNAEGSDGTAVTARFDESGNLVYLNRNGEVSEPVTLKIPASLAGLLPGYAEAIAGLTVGESGTPEPVQERVTTARHWAETSKNTGQEVQSP